MILVNYCSLKSLFIIARFMITIIMQTYGNSIQSRLKLRVQPLAGEPEKNVIRDGPLVNL